MANASDKTRVSEREATAMKQAMVQHLKNPGNRTCADCPRTGPTWVSANLGVFICLDCSGQHRHLGVHLSQVRSITLDTMTPAHFQFLIRMNNAQANTYWEARMPSSHVKTEDNRKVTISSKYAFKKWVDLKLPTPDLASLGTHPWFQNGAPPAVAPQTPRNGMKPPIVAASPKQAPPKQTFTIAKPPEPAKPPVNLIDFSADAPSVPTTASATTSTANQEPAADPFAYNATSLPTPIPQAPATNLTFDDCAAGLSLPPSSLAEPSYHASPSPASCDPFAASFSAPCTQQVQQQQQQPQSMLHSQPQVIPSVGYPTPVYSNPMPTPAYSNPVPNMMPINRATSATGMSAAPKTRTKKTAAELLALCEGLYAQPGPQGGQSSVGSPMHNYHMASGYQQYMGQAGVGGGPPVHNSYAALNYGQVLTPRQGSFTGNPAGAGHARAYPPK